MEGLDEEGLDQQRQHDRQGDDDRDLFEDGKQIAQGEFAPGTALPSEADLCERFDTSRNVMREVIKVLSTKRLIDAQRHRGLFVMPSEQWNYLDADVLEWVLEKGANPSLVRSVIERIRELGADHVAELPGVEERVRFSLPPGLRERDEG